MKEKPTLMQLRRAHNRASGQMITSQQLATMAVVDLADEFRLELGCAIRAEEAARVMAAFSTLTGQTYTLQDITIASPGGITV